MSFDMPTVPPTLTPAERAIALYQKVMGVNRDAAEHAYMFVDMSLASTKAQGNPWNRSISDEGWAPEGKNGR